MSPKPPTPTPALITLIAAVLIGMPSALLAGYHLIHGQKAAAAYLALAATTCLGAWIGLWVSRWLPVLPGDPELATEPSTGSPVHERVAQARLHTLIQVREQVTDIRAGIQDHSFNLAQALQELDQLLSTGPLSLEEITRGVLTANAELKLQSTTAPATPHPVVEYTGTFGGEESFVDGLPPFWSGTLRRNWWGTVTAKGFYNGPDVRRPICRVKGQWWTRTEARDQIREQVREQVRYWVEETIAADAADAAEDAASWPGPGTDVTGATR